MSDSKKVDRRTVLASSLAFAGLALAGCSSSAESGPTGAGGTSCATGGTGGTGAGGAAGTGGTTCSQTMTGTHMHPLTIPGADVAKGVDETYVLQDCGLGHTHELMVTAYDFAYLQAGATRMIDSTTTNAHLHTVSITCTTA